MNEDMIIRTPLLQFSPGKNKIFLKPENLQAFGSYKIRGVTSAVKCASERVLNQGLVAASAGNMAQAVAFMAQKLKVNCTIYVPNSAPQIKKQMITALGANLIELPFEEVWHLVKHPPQNRDGLFIHPVFTPGLLEGYGQIARELLTDRPELDAVVIPFGVGGLTLGMARTLKVLKPAIEIYACEPETAAPLAASLSLGRPIQIDRRASFVDAIGTPEVLPQVFAEAKALLSGSIVVGIDEIRASVNVLARISKLVCEGAAAASVAAGMRLAQKNPNKEIACILTGGNVPQQVLIDCLA